MNGWGVVSGAIILLNGASSAGKSTLARALQARLPLPFRHWSIDVFFVGVHRPLGELERRERACLIEAWVARHAPSAFARMRDARRMP